MSKQKNSLSLETRVAVIDEKIDNLADGVKNITTKLEKDYVTNDRFAPIQKIVYGMVGLILMAVAGAILTLVLNHK